MGGNKDRPAESEPNYIVAVTTPTSQTWPTLISTDFAILTLETRYNRKKAAIFEVQSQRRANFPSLFAFDPLVDPRDILDRRREQQPVVVGTRVRLSPIIFKYDKLATFLLIL